MNRLQYAYSLYLKQHAHNPVDWYPWGEEAFERAIKEDKPVLVSIGYAACHWCHVMERESFEDEKVAGVMNDHFICIKVDREEHPEVDHMFMDALQIMTGQGGWPLNIFVTPDKKPFYGGTYFPPQPLYKRASWMEVLEGIAHLWKEKRDEIEAQGVQLMRHLVQVSATIAHDMPLEDFNAGTAYEHIMRQADRGNGGFGSAPKFPGSMAIRYLLADDYHYNRKEGKEHAVFSLKKMLWSGMYDQVGGGFCRYATDNEWMVPHFEKMLYDNALLISVMADAYKISKDDIFRSAIIQTIDFCKRELSDGAGFMSALDADSEGTEGKYYVWSAQELDSLLSEEERALYSYYNITEVGNWEYSNIIHATGSIEQWAAEQGADRERIIELRKSFLQKLFRARESRIPPALDNKKQLSWNALMNMALSDAYAALGDATYKEDAELHMRWMLQQFIAEGQLLHVNYGDRKIQGNADDWSYLIRALCRLGEITGKEEWWVHANKILGTFEHAFDDETRTFYYFSTRNDDMIRIRKIEQYDNATPSSNSIMAGNLMLLGWVFDNPAFTERSIRMWKKMQSLAERYPLAYACWVKGLLHSGKMEMLQVIGYPAHNEYNRLLQLYLPDRLLLHKGEEYSELPVLADKEVQEGEVVIYECTENYCKSPVYGLSEWLKKKC